MAIPVLAIFAALLYTAGTTSAAASISVVGSSTFTSTGQWLQVRVEKPAPELGDVVGLFVWNGPYANAAALGQDILAQTAIKYWFPAQVNASYLALNQTTFRIQLPNYRTNLFLAFFGAATYGGNYGGFLLPPFLLGITAPIVNANPNEIQHVHINVVSTAVATCLVAFQWTTKSWQIPVARYWLEGVARTPANAKGPFNGNVTAYSRRDMCGAPANTTGWFEPGRLNYVYISLPLGATIYYQVGSKLTGTWSPTYSFTTPPQPRARKPVNIIWCADYGNKAPDSSFQFGNESPSTKFDIPPSAGSLADINNGNYWFTQNVYMITGAATSQGGSALTSAAIERELRKGKPYHAMFISGDVSYASGYQTQWEQFFLQNAYTFARVPLYVALGNHERNWPVGGDRFRYYPLALDEDSGGECGVSTLKRFINPPPFTPLRNPRAPALPDTPWYSIDIGPIHFLTYSSEHDLYVNSPQWLFVKNDLASVNRTKTPFVVVSGHRPMHINSIDGVLPTSNLLVGQQTLQAFEDLFYIYEVDLVLHGHHHSYQRTKPVYKRNVTQGAPVYVVAGNAGYEFSLIFQPSNPDYFEKILVRNGFLRFSANYTALRVQLIHAVDDSILDDFTLTKPANYKTSTAARQAFVAARANVSDQYSTKLMTNFSLAELSNDFAAVRPYINNTVIGTAFYLFSQNNNATYVQYLLTNNINFASNLAAVYVSWDFVANYVIPVVLQFHPEILVANPTLATSINVVRQSTQFGRSLLAKGAGRR